MQVTGNKISNNFKIVSGSFSDQLSGVYDLFIYLNESEISCAVADTKNSVFIAFESWSSLENLTPDNFTHAVITESSLLRNNIYRRVICSVGFRSSTIIPEALFSQETAKDQLLLSCEIDDSYEIHIDEIASLRAKIIFALPAEVVKLITTQFRNIELHHIANPMISFLLANRKNSNESTMHINIQNSFFEIFVTRGNTLLLYNTYNSFSSEEMLYYVLFVCEQLQLNPESLEVNMSGSVNEENSFYQLAKNYFNHFNFANRPQNFAYAFDTKVLPSHFHFNLFSSLVCVS